MNKRKRFSSATFTKRVDRETGRHRTRRVRSEPAVCGSCGAVYGKRRWVSAAEAASRAGDFDLREATPRTCPACKQQNDGVPNGFVYVGGAFFKQHRAEVEGLLRNEAERAAIDNPTARVMRWEAEEAGTLTLSTTTEHLAQRLGRALEKAFCGEVRYDFSHENKLARVSWSRD